MPLHQVAQLTNDQILQLHALYQHEWWSAGRSVEDVRRMLRETDLLIGLVESETGRLVGFCRVLSDFVYHATLYDVIVAADDRGRGLGRRLMDAVVAHPRLQDVKALWLCCRPELARFYERWGFADSRDDFIWMRRGASAAAGNPAER